MIADFPPMLYKIRLYFYNAGIYVEGNLPIRGDYKNLKGGSG